MCEKMMGLNAGNVSMPIGFEFRARESTAGVAVDGQMLVRTGETLLLPRHAIRMSTEENVATVWCSQSVLLQ